MGVPQSGAVSSNRTSRSRRLHTYWTVALLCAAVFWLASIIVEITNNLSPGLLPPSLTNVAAREGLFAIGSGCLALEIWLKTDYHRVSSASSDAQSAEIRPGSRLGSAARKTVNALLLAIPVIAWGIVLIYHPTGASYDQVSGIITLVSVANAGWITVAYFRWLLWQGRKNR